jgi:hypothetical protein
LWQTTIPQHLDLLGALLLAFLVLSRQINGTIWPCGGTAVPLTFLVDGVLQDSKPYYPVPGQGMSYHDENPLYFGMATSRGAGFTPDDFIGQIENTKIGSHSGVSFHNLIDSIHTERFCQWKTEKNGYSKNYLFPN